MNMTRRPPRALPPADPNAPRLGPDYSKPLIELFQYGYSGPEVLAWAVITQAVEDVKQLRAAGVLNRTGALQAWPVRHYRHHQNGKTYKARRHVAGMSQGSQAEELREWFHGPGAQAWLDAVNSPYSAQELWRRALAGERIMEVAR